MMESAQLGQALVQAGLLNEAHLKHALEVQESTGGDLVEILPRLGYIREAVLVKHIADEQHMRFVDPESMAVDDELMSKIPREVLERHEIVPLKGEDGVLLALSDPDDFQGIDEIQFVTNRPIESALAVRASIKKAVAGYYQRAGTRKKSGDERPRAIPEATKRILSLASDQLLRALVLALIEKGEVSADRILAHAADAEAAARGR